jgi:hypothetical protein
VRPSVTSVDAVPRRRSDPTLPGLGPPSQSRGPVERAASADLAALRTHDALLPDASALAVLYRRLARAVDVASAAGEAYTVAYVGHRLVECHAYLTGHRADQPADVDPFAIAAPVVDPSYT